jgi:hypothetical protein
MNTLASILVVVLLAVPLVIVGAVFVWAARKDGADDEDTQRRFGRRSTRLGRCGDTLPIWHPVEHAPALSAGG